MGRVSYHKYLGNGASSPDQRLVEGAGRGGVSCQGAIEEGLVRVMAVIRTGSITASDPGEVIKSDKNILRASSSRASVLSARHSGVLALAVKRDINYGYFE